MWRQGSVVPQNVRDNLIVGGIPAKTIKKTAEN